MIRMQQSKKRSILCKIAESFDLTEEEDAEMCCYSG